ncbi:MAG: multiubiquitin domain-containing protein [Actinobacteria bacterium]|nr:multiubiquitin domain-containing protein [Actinomycetota bacterium]
MKTKTVINIFINEAHFKVDSDSATGRELKELAGIPASNLLFRDLPGQQEDPPVPDDEPVPLKSGDRFYDMPQGNFG